MTNIQRFIIALTQPVSIPTIFRSHRKANDKHFEVKYYH